MIKDVIWKAILLLLLCQWSSGRRQQHSSCFSKFGSSGAKREVWLSLNGGYFLDHLKTDERFQKNQPTLTNTVDTFDSPPRFRKLYGQRLSAYFIPPKTGDYTFVVTCDSVCEIFLSSSEDPSRKVAILEIEQKHRTDIDKFDVFPAQRSCPQRLKRHVVYYLEGLHSNYIEKDHMRLRVKLPGSEDLKVLDRGYLIQFTLALDCPSLRHYCNVRCGGSSYTLLKAVDPVTKVCMSHKASTEDVWRPTTRHIYSPLKIAVQVKTSTSVLISWNFQDPLSLDDVTGFRLAYTYWAPHHEGEAGRWVAFNTILGPNMTFTELKGLKKFTKYCIKVFYIVGEEESEPGNCAFATTLEDVPSKAPKLRKVVNHQLRSILVAWNPLPPQFIHGQILGYRLNLTNLNNTSNSPSGVATGSNTLSVIISGLEMLTRYCVRVLAYTQRGDGPQSKCTDVFTWTDDYLPAITIVNKSSPTFLVVRMDTLPYYLNGHSVGYMLSYRLVRSASETIKDSENKNRQVAANVTKYYVTGLSSFSTYEVWIRPMLKRGIGTVSFLASGETCRCPSHMTAWWRQLPPYTQKSASSSPSGIIPDILQDMLFHVCGNCQAFKKLDVVYKYHSSRTKRTTKTIDSEADFIFPERKSIEAQSLKKSSRFVSLLDVPGFAFLTSKKDNKVYSRQVATSVFQCWPIMVMSLAMTLVAGCVIWFLETVHNPNQFHHHFYAGITEGVWWSFITMTTVGYGDKVPTTKLGRAFAILWFFVGMAVVAILVASITSSLSVKMLNDRNNVNKDKRMASLDNPLDYKALLRVGKHATKRDTYSDLDKLVDAFKLGVAEGIVVDMYMAGFRTDLFNGTWYKVSSILEQKFSYGVEIGGNASKLEKLFREYAEGRQDAGIKTLQKARADVKVDTQFAAHHSKALNMPDFLDSSTDLFKITIFLAVAALCFCTVMGMLFHSWRRNKEHRRSETDGLQNSLDHFLSTKRELKEMLEEFNRRMRRTYARLKLKHKKERDELLRLRKYERAKGPHIIWL